MAGSLSAYYGRAKSGIAGINPREMAQLGEDWLIVAATGAGIGIVSNMMGGLDHKVANVPVPVDGAISVGLGVAGLAMGGETGKMLKIASIAAGGSAAVRTFETLFKEGFGSKGGVKVKGEFEELGWSNPEYFPGSHYRGSAFAFGQSHQDRLVEAAKYL